MTILLGHVTCDECGQAGEYDGPQYSMIEAIGAYQRRTGLKAVGLHRKMADELFHQRFVACAGCHGQGLIDYHHGVGYIVCGNCHGNGYIFNGSKEEWQDIREQVLGSFPDAIVDPDRCRDIENQVFLFSPLPSELGSRPEN